MQIKTDNMLWTRLQEMTESFLAQRDTPVHHYLPAQKLQDKINLHIPASKQDFSQVFKALEDYLQYSVNTNHRFFNNQLYGKPLLPALIGEFISTLANTSMATYEIAPVATLMEHKIIEHLCKIIGYEAGEGIMLTGGSNANLMALHLARQRKNPLHKQEGHQGVSYAVYVSEEAHYSFQKAVNLIGLGENSLYLIPTDNRGKILPQEFEKLVERSLSEGRVPLLVASTAGTTVRGAFDPIYEINKMARRFKIWHHIDGAWGGPALLSQKHKHLLKGSELSDSFTWDAHKVMGAGLISSFILVKERGSLLEANDGGGQTYIFHETENDFYDFGPTSLQCGRKVDALKLWLNWQYLGDQGQEELIDGQFEKAAYFQKRIKEHPRFRLVYEPEYLNVCFQVLPKESMTDINQYNLQLHHQLIKSGKAMINFSRNKEGEIFFRMVFANTALEKDDIDELLEIILDTKLS